MAAYDRMKEVEEFDSSKMGVKGLSDSSITSIPKIFIHPPETLSTLKSSQDDTTIAIPVIDLAKINSPVDRPNIIQQVKEAAKSWGFPKMKAKFYKREEKSGVMWTSNNDLYRSKAASWHDYLQVWMSPEKSEEEDIPEICRREALAWDFHAQMIITNGEYNSIQHRVLANTWEEPRISVVMFLNVVKWKESGSYGPLSELISAEKPAIYREFTKEEYFDNFYSKGLDCKSLIDKLKL
ncbi:hypothetical protein Pint_36056 [Pistacia integerrima]|uniref:Uncharacterized protein n=1 Tax=Pistacia integerrima TaxID=434235 RepID=A0ACC0Y3F8_9ROSI|nr:hypothetical protein Pint_36056 [Pistacia integerrima]